MSADYIRDMRPEYDNFLVRLANGDLVSVYASDPLIAEAIAGAGSKVEIDPWHVWPGGVYPTDYGDEVAGDDDAE